MISYSTTKEKKMRSRNKFVHENLSIQVKNSNV